MHACWTHVCPTRVRRNGACVLRVRRSLISALHCILFIISFLFSLFLSVKRLIESQRVEFILFDKRFCILVLRTDLKNSYFFIDGTTSINISKATAFMVE